MSNRLEGGRTGLAILTVIAVVMTLFAVFGAGTAQAVSSTGTCTEVDEKYVEFRFVFVNGTVIEGDNCPGSNWRAGGGFDADFKGTGGSDDYPNGPGMTLHLSCSDDFAGGWSKLGGQPKAGVDTNWQIASWSITRYLWDSNLERFEVVKECSGALATTTTTSTTTTEATTTTTQATTTTTEATTTTTEATTTTTEATTTTAIQGTSTLPFTGVESGGMATLALSLMAAGAAGVVFGRSPQRED